MPKREFASHPHQRRTPPSSEELKVKDTKDLKAELDEVLDDIDAVLEENAEEFVSSYVQKGGE